MIDPVDDISDLLGALHLKYPGTWRKPGLAAEALCVQMFYSREEKELRTFVESRPRWNRQWVGGAMGVMWNPVFYSPQIYALGRIVADGVTRREILTKLPLPDKALILFAWDNLRSIRHLLATREGLPEKVQETLINDHAGEVILALAANPTVTSPNVLPKLAFNTNTSVRLRVAKRNNLATNFQLALANDEEEPVRQAIATNVNCEEEYRIVAGLR